LTTVDHASIKAAAKYDAVIVMAGTDALTSRESMDRDSLDLPGAQAAMIRQAETANPNTIVYLETVGDVNLSSFESTTPALLWSSFNGEEQGGALADVLTGKVDPSGRLPFTWYADENQLSVITDYNIRASALTDGRTYQYFTGTPAFPFGYGLSYTQFGYSNLRVDHPTISANGTIAVTAKVTNLGTTVGSQVPQLYVTTPFEPASAQRPIKRLEAFQKVTLAPGQARTITMTVPASRVAFWDDRAERYVVDPGEYGLEMSTSSADSDIRLHAAVGISGTIDETPAVVSVKPIETDDRASGVAQRVFFDTGTTVDPQLTVAMTDLHLYGYMTKGHSARLPTGLTVSFHSDNDRVVDVHGSVLRTVGSGIATVTVAVRSHGRTASTSFTVDVDGDADRARH
jgi:beta-glucosidase